MATISASNEDVNSDGCVDMFPQYNMNKSTYFSLQNIYFYS